MNKYRLTICALLALAAVICGSRLLACDDYVHLWMPFEEHLSDTVSPEGLYWSVKETLRQRMTDFNGSVAVCFSPEAGAAKEQIDAVKQTFEAMADPKFRWAPENTPLGLENSADSSLWIDVVNQKRLTYLWKDMNDPPFSLIRTGELDTARVRMLLMSSEHEVLFIDEVPVMYFFEIDYLCPTWVSAGGIWLRRVALQMGQMDKIHEWTISEPSSEEQLHTQPQGMHRYFFGDKVNENVAIPVIIAPGRPIETIEPRSKTDMLEQ